MNDLISVILSTFNEPINMIDKSINSILKQTYENIELIIINDNPDREELENYLHETSAQNDCIRYIQNKINVGLVDSLNRGLSIANGEYIARMDADDISDNRRLEKQLYFLLENDLDIVGSSVIVIDEFDKEIGAITVPTEFKKIKKYYNYGSCLLHPTWLLKKSVYSSLKGYRNIKTCEDYDFMLRAFNNGFTAGNIPEKLLYYRVRKDGISSSYEAKQKLTTYYLQKNRYRIKKVSVEMINEYLTSLKYQKDLKVINKYLSVKNSYKNDKRIDLLNLFNMLINKYFYISMIKTIRESLLSRN